METERIYFGTRDSIVATHSNPILVLQNGASTKTVHQWFVFRLCPKVMDAIAPKSGDGFGVVPSRVCDPFVISNMRNWCSLFPFGQFQ